MTDQDWLSECFREAASRVDAQIAQAAPPIPSGPVGRRSTLPAVWVAFVVAALAVAGYLLLGHGSSSPTAQPGGVHDRGGRVGAANPTAHTGGSSTSRGGRGLPVGRCGSGMVAHWSESDPGESMSGLVYYLQYTNSGNTVCRVEGYPSVQPTTRRLRETDSQTSSISVDPIPLAPVTLSVGGTATAQVLSTRSTMSSHCVAPSRWRVSLPNTTFVTIDAARRFPATVCDDSRIWVTPWYLDPEQPRPTR